MTMKEVEETENWLSEEVIFVTDRSAVPALETVRVWVDDCPTWTLPKDKLVADRAMSGTVPAPVRETVRLFSSGSLLTMVNVPNWLPSEAGVKVTVTFWLLPAVTVKEVVESVNWLSEEVIPVTDRSAVPVLETIRV